MPREEWRRIQNKSDGGKSKRKQLVTTTDAQQNAFRVQAGHAEQFAKIARESARINSPLSKYHSLFSSSSPILTLVPSVEAYADQLADSWNQSGARNPCVYNPVPSYRTLTSTTAYGLNYSIPAATQWCIVLYPGHSMDTSDTESMDGVAYHARTMLIGGTTATNRFHIGPVGSTTESKSAIGFHYEEAVGLDSFPVSSTATCLPILAEKSLPFTALTGSHGHTRWMMNGMAVRIFNKTSGGNRGGAIDSVQPQNASGNVSWSGVTSQPTYNTTEEINENDGYNLAWIPRPEDMAFWHTADDGNVQVYQAEGAAILLRFRNTTAATQSVSAYIKCNWELAGESLSTVTSPTVPEPSAKDVVGPALAVVQNTTHTAKDLGLVSTVMHNTRGLGGTLVHAAKAAVPVAKYLAPRIGKAFADASPALHDTLAAMLSGA